MEDLKRLTGPDGVHRLDRELDYLRCLELIHPEAGGFPLYEDNETEPDAGDEQESQTYIGEELRRTYSEEELLSYSEEERRVVAPDFYPEAANITPMSLCLSL